MEKIKRVLAKVFRTIFGLQITERLATIYYCSFLKPHELREAIIGFAGLKLRMTMAETHLKHLYANYPQVGGKVNEALRRMSSTDKDTRDYFKPILKQLRGSDQVLRQRYRTRIKDLMEAGILATHHRDILDLGCGDGVVSACLVEALPQAQRIIGVDIELDGFRTHVMEQKAKLVVEERTAFINDELKVVQCDPADLILCLHTYEHLSFYEQVEFLFLSAQRLKIGGQLFLEMPNCLNPRVRSDYFWMDPQHARNPSVTLLVHILAEIGLETTVLLFDSKQNRIAWQNYLDNVFGLPTDDYLDLCVIATKHSAHAGNA